MSDWPPPEDWGAVDELFQAALDRPRQEREAFLKEVGAERPELRTELEALLQAVEDADPWIGRSEATIHRLAREAFSVDPDAPSSTDGDSAARTRGSEGA